MTNEPITVGTTDNIGFFFLNHKNSAIGTGGVGTVTREMLKSHPEINYIYCDSMPSHVQMDTEHYLSFSKNDFTALHGEYTKLYLWPLLHCIDVGVDAKVLPLARARYLKAARKYAYLAVKAAKKKYPNSHRLYWINDYVLLGSIARVRELDPHAVIAFSLRTSFGTSTDSPNLTEKDVELMKTNLMKANFITVHRKSDKNNLHLLLDLGQLDIEVVPMGNNKSYRRSLLNTSQSQEVASDLKNEFGNIKIITSISRFEVSKGIDYELDLIETLLESHPDLREKFVFMRYSYISAVKQRTVYYDTYKKHIENRIYQINQRFGSERWIPIISDLNRKLSDNDVSGVLSSSDALLIASYADGFNHLALEYIYSRKRKKARLFVSDIGARDYLRGSIPITHKARIDADSMYSSIKDDNFTDVMLSALLKYSAGKLSSKKWVDAIMSKMLTEAREKI